MENFNNCAPTLKKEKRVGAQLLKILVRSEELSFFLFLYIVSRI